MMKNVVIIDAKRTAVGKAHKGSLRDTRPDDFAAKLLENMFKKNNINKKDIKDLVVGCAMPEGEQGMNIAKTIGMLAKLPYQVPAFTVNRFCSSGLQAVNNVAQAIEVDNIDVGIAGGVESMSMVPMGGYTFNSNSNIVDNNIDFYTTMGLTGENVADLYEISREEQDKFALESHRKALKSIKNNDFKDEIEAVNVSVYDKHTKVPLEFSVDDGPRETSFEKLQKLKPCFKKNGSVTAGNSSQMSDGAAFLVLSSEKYALKNKLNILGYFRDFSVVGVPPHIMGIGPLEAIRQLLDKCNLSISDIGVFEINEAFASQAVYCIKKLNIDPSIVNIHGGAIAQGHPLGCTGARQSVTILHEMKRRNARFGIVSMCIGGGMGAAALFENTKK
jgi:acetyl-CoA acyltransferase